MQEPFQAFCGEAKKKTYIFFVRNLLPLYLVCKKCISAQKTELRNSACQFQINMVNQFSCLKGSNVFNGIVLPMNKLLKYFRAPAF